MNILKTLLMTFFLTCFSAVGANATSVGEKWYETTQQKENESVTKDILIKLNKIQGGLYERQASGTTNVQEYVDENLGNLAVTSAGMIFPFLILAGIFLIALAIKQLLMDYDQPRHGGFMGNLYAGIFKLAIGVILLNSKHLLNMFQEGTFTQKEVIIFLIDASITFIQISGLIAVIYALFKLTNRDPQTRNFPLLKSGAILVGGVLFMNIVSVIAFFTN